MYEYVDWMSCRGFKQTNCLFKTRRDEHYYRRTGSIRYKTEKWCKLCYLENNRLKNLKDYEKNKKKRLASQKTFRTVHKEEYNERAREYYQKRRIAAIEQKREKYAREHPKKERKKRKRSTNADNHPWKHLTFGKKKDNYEIHMAK
jgi:hypothetical protein